MRFLKSVLVFMILTLSVGCTSVNLTEPYASDFTTSGPLGEDCFQVLIKVEPDKDAVTMHERRESAFIKAKKIIYSEAENQIIKYYDSVKKDTASDQQGDDSGIKKAASSYAGSGKLEQEFYLGDDSVVLIYRIYKKGIKSDILSK